VHENIEAFGGDPEKVTLFGDSAGAGSISSHFFSKESWPYFQRAILQSGSITFSYGIVNMAAAKILSQKFINSVNCTNDEHALECLQNLTTHQVLEHYRTTRYSMTRDFLLPVVDGDFYPDVPAVLLKQGKHKKLDILLGVCKHEAFLWNFGHLHHNQSTSYYVNHFKRALRFTLQGLLKLYLILLKGMYFMWPCKD
jgi:carboxylesterase type B